MKTHKKTPNTELENLNHAIWITREKIHAAHETIRDLERKLTNQLSEFHRQVRKTQDCGLRTQD